VVSAAQSLAVPEAAAFSSELRRWPVVRRLVFRFLCAYFVLYSLPSRGRVSIVGLIPGTSFLTQKYVAMWQSICPWVGSHVFHLSGRAITYVPTGSGDTTLDYIQNLLFLVFAVVAAILWSVLDRKRGDYRKLEPWLRLLVRYVLAFTLFSYGFAKVFPLQFGTPGFLRLLEPYGDFSPMGSLWWFMGASIPYIIFAGAAEVLGGLLLVFRRTAALGALVAFAVMLNVMMLNYCYDVPVKLYSTNLVLMAAYLAAFDLRRLLDVFVRNCTSAPADVPGPIFARRWARISAIAIQVLMVGYALYGNVYGGWQAYKQRYINPSRPPIYGLYEVENFTRNGQDAPPLITDATRWRKVIAESPASITIKMMSDTAKGYAAEYDEAKGIVTLSEFNDKTKKYPLTYKRPDSDHLDLEGIVAGDSLSMRLRKIDTSKFLLVSRGFHWINEMPLNR
jgi:uncharacterized membrane protein YphA (DoxX/SURF4 family)